MKTLEILISGRVQGVGYRFFAVRTANVLKIKGTAKNLLDNRVKVVASGTEKALNKFLIELKEGPGLAYVSDLTVNELPGFIKYGDFRIDY